MAKNCSELFRTVPELFPDGTVRNRSVPGAVRNRSEQFGRHPRARAAAEPTNRSPQNRLSRTDPRLDHIVVTSRRFESELSHVAPAEEQPLQQFLQHQSREQSTWRSVRREHHRLDQRNALHRADIMSLLPANGVLHEQRARAATLRLQRHAAGSSVHVSRPRHLLPRRPQHLPQRRPRVHDRERVDATRLSNP